MVDGDDAATDSAAATDPEFASLLEKLHESYNFDFREYKPASLARRIRSRMSQVHADTFEAYAQLLDARPDEHVTLFNTILINVTGFFRDPEAWTTLAEEIVPRLVDDAAAMRSLRDGMAQGLMVIDHLGVVRTWNHSAERMWGFRNEQVVGREFFGLPLVEVVQRLRPAFERMLTTGEIQQLEGVSYTLPGGSKRRVVLRIAPVRDGGGDVVGGIGTAWPEDGRPA